MSVVIRSQSTGTWAANGSSGTLTFAKPSGMAEGDLLLAFVAKGDTGTVSPPDNSWTSASNNQSPSGGGVVGSIWYKIATSLDVSGSTANFPFGTGTGTNNLYSNGALLALIGQTTNSPINAVTGNGGNLAGGSTVVAPSVTTTADYCQLFTFFTVAANGAQASLSPPAGETSVYATTTAGSSGYLPTLVATERAGLAGPTGDKTATASSNLPTSSSQVTAVIAVRAALSPPSVALNSPAAGAYVDFTRAQTFTWQATADPGVDAQTAYAFRRQYTPSGGSLTTQWWNGSTWTNAETYVTSTAGSVTFPANTWTNGNVFTWTVSAANVQGNGLYATAQQVTGRADPTVAWTTPSSDGSSTANSGPVLTMAGTPASGVSLTGSDMRVLTSAEYTANGPTGASVYSSSSAGGFTASYDLPGGTLSAGNYVVVGRARQAGDQTGPWSARTFTVAPTVIAAPTITATVAATGMPRVDAAVAWTRGTATGSAAVTVQRSIDGGATWSAVGAVAGGASGNLAGAVTDPSIPTAVPTLYRARADTVDGDSTGQSPWVTASAVTLQVPRETLVNLATGVVASLRLASATRTARPWAGEVIYPLDSDVPIILSGLPSRPEGEAVAACVTWAEGEALELLLMGVQALLWRRPPTSDGAARRDQLVRTKPGSVTLRQFADDRVRWAACVIQWSWAEVG